MCCFGVGQEPFRCEHVVMDLWKWRCLSLGGHHDPLSCVTSQESGARRTSILAAFSTRHLENPTTPDLGICTFCILSAECPPWRLPYDSWLPSHLYLLFHPTPLLPTFFTSSPSSFLRVFPGCPMGRAYLATSSSLCASFSQPPDCLLPAWHPSLEYS